MEPFGVFVRLSSSSVVGLSRRAHALGDTDDAGTDLRQLYTEGDVVRARVLTVNPVLKKVPIYFFNVPFTFSHCSFVATAATDKFGSR